MKRFFGICFLLAVVLAIIGCGARNGNSRADSRSAAAAVDSDFFNRKIEGEITVSAYESMSYSNYLKEAGSVFEALYPGTKVNVETFSAMPEIRTMDQGNYTLAISERTQDVPQTRSDYLNRVSTNIMSGAGADIYAIDIIPLHKFVESGSLENLEPYMNGDPDFNRADYRQNILDALRYRGGTWFLPLDYFFRYYAYDATLVPTEAAAGFGVDKAFSTRELLDLGIPLYDGSYMLFNSTGGAGGMFHQLLNENMASFVNPETGRANFADGGFASLLASVSGYAQQGYIPQGITVGQDSGELMLQITRTPTDRYFFKRNNDISLISQFGRNAGVRMMMVTGGAAPALESDDEIAGIQANADGSVPFGYNQAFAINSQSKNKETAWAFMKFLLSKEMQLSISPYNLPLNNEAREEIAGHAFYQNSGSRTPNEQQKQALDAYRAAVEKLSDMINCYAVSDTSLNDMIMAEAQYYFDGVRGADEVARILQSKADLYLSE